MNGGRHDRSFGAVCLYVFLSYTLSLSNGQTILVVTGAPDLLVLLLDSSLCPCLSPFGFRCSRVCVRDHGALSLPLSTGGVDGGGGVGEGMKSQICFFIESRYGQNTGRCAVLFFLPCLLSPYFGQSCALLSVREQRAQLLSHSRG